MTIDGNTVTFSSGHKRFANCGVIGLSPTLSVSEGWDGGFWDDGSDYDRDDTDAFEDQPLTAADLIELADYMIERWTQFKGKIREEQLNSKPPFQPLPNPTA